jgi:hypothetical protein
MAATGLPGQARAMHATKREVGLVRVLDDGASIRRQNKERRRARRGGSWQHHANSN